MKATPVPHERRLPFGGRTKFGAYRLFVQVACIGQELLQDLFSGRLIGWAMDDKKETDLCLRAPQTAIDKRKLLPGQLHHFD